jgi:hypothetical protein
MGFMVDRGTMRQVLLRVFRHTNLQNISINVPFRLSQEEADHDPIRESHPQRVPPNTKKHKTNKMSEGLCTDRKKEVGMLV